MEIIKYCLVLINRGDRRDVGGGGVAVAAVVSYVMLVVAMR